MDRIEQLERAIAAAKRDPDGGKVLLPVEVAETLLDTIQDLPDGPYNLGSARLRYVPPDELGITPRPGAIRTDPA